MKKIKTLMIGSGAFSKALSSVLLSNNQNVYVYGINQNELLNFDSYFKDLYDRKINPVEVGKISTNLKELFNEQIDVVILCTPSFEINNIIDLIKPFIKPEMIVVSTSKGLNWNDNNIFYTELLKNELCCNICSLVGPTFAVDILEHQKTIINVVSEKNQVINLLKSIFDNDFFKLIECNDFIGASLLSSLKNVLAIVCGLVSGIGCSNNTFSSLLTIGINEINNILSKFNVKKDTILNFCGLGDIFLTCTDKKSRNFSFGYQIAQYGLNEALKLNEHILVEGLNTIKNLYKLIDISNQKEYPTFSLLWKLLNNEIEVNNYIEYLWKIL